MATARLINVSTLASAIATVLLTSAVAQATCQQLEAGDSSQLSSGSSSVTPNRVQVATYEMIDHADYSQGEDWFQETISKEFDRDFARRTWFNGKRGHFLLGAPERRSANAPGPNITTNQHGAIRPAGTVGGAGSVGGVGTLESLQPSVNRLLRFPVASSNGSISAPSIVSNVKLVATVYFYPRTTGEQLKAKPCNEP